MPVNSILSGSVRPKHAAKTLKTRDPDASSRCALTHSVSRPAPRKKTPRAWQLPRTIPNWTKNYRTRAARLRGFRRADEIDLKLRARASPIVVRGSNSNLQKRSCDDTFDHAASIAGLVDGPTSDDC
ncbi:MAG: hypothetical protein ABWY64_22890 [Tardiphaga sp.]